MSTITLQPDLIGQLEKVAVEKSVRPEELLETAVRIHLRQIEREKIKAEAKAFRFMHADLAKKHLGQYVAIFNGKVVDHGQDFHSVHSRIRARFGRDSVLIRRVDDTPERVFVFRSPRLVRGEP